MPAEHGARTVPGGARGTGGEVAVGRHGSLLLCQELAERGQGCGSRDGIAAELGACVLFSEEVLEVGCPPGCRGGLESQGYQAGPGADLAGGQRAWCACAGQPGRAGVVSGLMDGPGDRDYQLRIDGFGCAEQGGDTAGRSTAAAGCPGVGRGYLIALLSTGSPSEDYGIGTIDELSAIIWRQLAASGHS
jgi:hypothetical protein